MKLVIEEAEKDNHVGFIPTHGVVRGKEIIGGVAFRQPWTVDLWMHTQRARPRESAAMVNLTENILIGWGAKEAVYPINPTSPFFTVAESWGMKKLVCVPFLRKF